MANIRAFAVDQGFNIFIAGPSGAAVMCVYRYIWGCSSWAAIAAGVLLFVTAWSTVQFVKHELRSRPTRHGPTPRSKQLRSFWVASGLVVSLLIMIFFPFFIWKWEGSGLTRFGGSYSHPGEPYLHLPEATSDELLRPRIVGKTVYLYNVPRDSASNTTISERTFEDCLIVGPCATVSTGRGAVYLECGFGVPFDVDSLFFVVDKDRRVVGAIGLDHCLFRKCEFQNVALVGNKDWIQFMKQNTPYLKQKVLPPYIKEF
jgi:hypothetical protein